MGLNRSAFVTGKLQTKEFLMSMTRMLGIAACSLGVVLVVFAWQSSTTALDLLAVTVGGYARNTVFMAVARVVALTGGPAAYMTGKPTI